MAFLIRTIDFTADGREIVRERSVAGTSLTIGRAGENDLHLPDLAVEQEHARIDPGNGGKLRVAAVGTLGFKLDGKTTTTGEIDPRDGHELSFGSYRLTLSQEGDGPVEVTVRQVREVEGAGEVTRGFALGAALPGKRAMAWIGLAGEVRPDRHGEERE